MTPTQNRPRPAPSPSPPRKTKPARRQPQPLRVDTVIADLRDRIAVARPIGGEPLGAIAGELADLAESARALGEEPHHADPTVATDARERLLAIAALATAAAIELDRRTLAMPPVRIGDAA